MHATKNDRWLQHVTSITGKNWFWQNGYQWWKTAGFNIHSCKSVMILLHSSFGYSLSQGTRSSVALEFNNFSRTFLWQPCTFWKILHIQYTASLHTVIFTLQQNHYPYLNRVAEYSSHSIS